MNRLILLLSFALFLFPPYASADANTQQTTQESFVRGQITKVYDYKLKYISSYATYEEKIQIKLLEGNDKGMTIIVSQSGKPDSNYGKFKAGDQVVINSRLDHEGKIIYSIYETYRLDSFWILLVGFIILIVGIGGKKGIGAFIGLGISLFIISFWMIPQLTSGHDPVQTIVVATSFILLITTYIAHGFSIKTTVAVIGTAAALFFTGWISSILIEYLRLFGLGNEDIYQLQASASIPFNTQGLLLGAILIGTLGALNDITTTQSITIFTFVKENPKQKFFELFGKGMEIGKEHIASLVNTLVLAYTGSSLGIFFFFSLNPSHLPWWVILNNETTMEEIMATLVGSSALILAVPLTTFIAVFVALRGSTFRDFFSTFIKDHKPKK